uniref:FHA domain-containing protein n=1 Tax=Ostreococcus mediterraneus TaxID=1486918 RepID=A0A6U0DTP6_9CHLO|mmetsp:Transcript_2767/g.9963  ORF Transcript_2767/g.9963 Transcript_2767/m.9963 type:complete len:580 (+) Transcript_2767:304-2043(+)
MGIKEGLTELWDDLMSYRTLKVVKISDRRLAYVHKTLMAAILVYALISVIGAHTYMLKEKPRVYTSVSVNDTVREINLAVSTLSETYCDTSYTNFVGDTLVPEGAHLDNKCVTYNPTSEIVETSEGATFIATHKKSETFERQCDNETAQTGCSVTYLTEINQFPLDPDNLIFQIRPRFVTSWGYNGYPDTVTVYDSSTTIFEEYSTDDTNTTSRYPNMYLHEILLLADLELDDRNSIEVSTSFAGEFPLYRMTGVRLSVEFTFSNFRPMSDFKPFDFSARADMNVQLNSEGSFVESVDAIHFTGSADDVSQNGTIMKYRGVVLEYASAGLMGTADFYTAMMAIMSCFIMVSVATTVVDIIGAFIYDSFKDDKIEDDGERQHLEHMILNLETVGVPFGHDDLQILPNVSMKEFLQLLQRDIVKLHALAHHMSRDLAAAGVNQHTLSIQQPFKQTNIAKFKCRLIAPDRTEIYLTGGPQTLGRGHGGCESKRISHKQLSIIANVQSGVALVKGLHTKNVSGVALSGGAWQALSANDEVELEAGDMVTLLLDQNEQETTAEGVFIYAVDRIEDSSAKSWFSW